MLISHVSLNRLQPQINHRHRTIQAQNQSNRYWYNGNNNTNTHNIYIVVPYTKGLSVSFKKVYDKVGAHVHFKGGNTIKDLLVATKYKDTITQKGGVIYRFQRQVSYRNILGNQEEPLGTVLKNTLRPPPPYMNMVSLLDTVSLWTFFHCGQGGPSKKPYSKGEQSISQQEPGPPPPIMG